LDDLIVSAYGADPSGKESAGKSYVIFGKTDNTAINLFAEDNIRFTCVCSAIWVGFTSANNQIIQAIAVDIACVGG
jgi:hypothetical protein